MNCWTRCIPRFPAALLVIFGMFLLAAAPAAAQNAHPEANAPETHDQPDTAAASHTDENAGNAAAHGDSGHADGAGAAGDGAHAGEGDHGDHPVPSILATAPFIAILLCIAVLPLIHATEHWWHKNQSKFLVSVILAVITLIYYYARGFGLHGSEPGTGTVEAVIRHAVLDEYIPFIVLLFSLYTICGGIQLRGDLQATPLTNTVFLGIGASLASFIGTTGAAMLLIRPVLQTNKERRYVRHTVIFFIFLVANIGGSLLPIGDPPLFLGYLRGVPFTWTFALIPEWLFTCGLILVIYFFWDRYLYKKEPPLDHLLDETHVEPLRLRGALNFLWLLGVVLSVALLVPEKPFLGTGWVVPPFVREGAQLMFVLLAWITSSPTVRKENHFDFFAIIEVAVLFIGIFICMQVPVEILNAKGSELGLNTMPKFFWATGTLSSFLDNAPTYVVFFETAKALPTPEGISSLVVVGGQIAEHLLVAISLGAVFMGAMSYIGNGPNFMVKSIAEQASVRMPSFFGYMVYSCAVLIPVFILMNIVFFIILGH